MSLTTTDALSVTQIDQLNSSITMKPNSTTGEKFGTLFAEVVTDVVAQQAEIDALQGAYDTAIAMAYQGNRTIAQINALSPSAGDCYIATDAGTPSAGSSDALTAGDLTEYNGTSWKKLLDAVDGFPPAGTVVVVGNGALVSPLVEGTDEKKVATFNGSSLTPSLVAPTAGAFRKVSNSVSIYFGQVFEYNTTWNSNSGAVPAAAADRVTNTNTKTYFATTRTLAVADASVGDRYEFDVLVHVADDNSTDTLALTVELGAVTIVSIPSFNAATDDVIHIKGWFQIKATGASGSIQGVADVNGIAAGSPSASAQKIGPSQAIDISSNNVLRVSATWSAASTDNDVDLLGLYLTRIPSGS